MSANVIFRCTLKPYVVYICNYYKKSHRAPLKTSNPQQLVSAFLSWCSCVQQTKQLSPWILLSMFSSSERSMSTGQSPPHLLCSFKGEKGHKLMPSRVSNWHLFIFVVLMPYDDHRLELVLCPAFYLLLHHRPACARASERASVRFGKRPRL